MKATKKIVGAACALVAAVALSAGSTFAWFVSNGSVTATGLQVDVTTSNSYLVISDAYDTLRTENSTTISLAPTAATKLNPSAYEKTITSGNDLVSVSNWYTGKGTTPDNGELDNTSKTTLTSFDTFVIEEDIFVSVATGSEPVSSVEMTMAAVDGWDTTVGNSAISVIVLWQKITNGAAKSDWSDYVEANDANNHALIQNEGDTTLKLGEVTEENYLQIHIMVYFDGNNDDVKGTNAKSLEGVTLNFTFTDGRTSKIQALELY